MRVKPIPQSAFGAKLDSIADLFFFAAVITVTFLWMGERLFYYLPWFLAVAVIRLLGILIAARRYHEFVMLHTLGNKITGLLLFAAPLFILFGHEIVLLPLFAFAALSAVEEVLIHLTSKELDRDRRGLFRK